MRKGIILAFVLLCPATIVHADCPHWNMPEGAVKDSRILAFPEVGDIDLRQRSVPAGWSHYERALAAQWKDRNGRTHRQMLWSGLGSDPQPRLSVEDRALVLREEACEWRGACRGLTHRFTFSPRQGQFVATRQWSDWRDDPDTNTWTHAPVTAGPETMPIGGDCPADDVFVPRD